MLPMSYRELSVVPLCVIVYGEFWFTQGGKECRQEMTDTLMPTQGIDPINHPADSAESQWTPVW